MVKDVYQPDFKPLLRWPLDIQHFEHQGESFTVLRDHLGVSPEPVIVPAALLPILSRFDGRSSLQEIQQEGERFGLTFEILHQLCFDLDSLCLLESQKTEEKLSLLRQQYRSCKVREAILADQVYPADPDSLLQMINKFRQQVANYNEIAPSIKNPVALVSPHIDYQRGWEAYGALSHLWWGIDRPDIIFLLGTSHKPGSALFHLSDKDFSTPLGTFTAAKSVINRIVNIYGIERGFADELLHRNEHSLELQLPFIAERFQLEGLPEIVPILVGSLHQSFFEQRPPDSDTEFALFVSAITEAYLELQLQGRKVMFLCGVDLAHVGMQFGDKKPVDRSLQSDVELYDRKLLDSIAEGDDQRFFYQIAESADCYRVCGAPVIYTLLTIFRKLNIKIKGHCLSYRQAFDPSVDCLVSFSSLVLDCIE